MPVWIAIWSIYSREDFSHDTEDKGSNADAQKRDHYDKCDFDENRFLDP